MDGSEKPEDRIVRLMKGAAAKSSGYAPGAGDRTAKAPPLSHTVSVSGTGNFITSGDLHINIGRVVYFCRTP